MAEAFERDLAGFVESAAEGDEVAFGRIVAAYHGQMSRICVVIARDQALAEEAVQSAWAIAWTKIGTLRETDRLRPWLTSIAVNEVRQLLRKRGRRSQVETPLDVLTQPGGANPETGIDYLDMQSALEHLDPDDRALLALRYVAGFDATELSQITGLSAAGTRTRLKRLLDRLRQELQ